MNTTKKVHLALLTTATAFLTMNTAAQTLTQTFESGEDTSDWGANWVTSGSFGTTGPGFLAPSLGGSYAGYGSDQSGQQAYRNFYNNTVGLDVSTETYTVSMYVLLGVDPGNTPASGNFNILDGNYGDATANIQLNYMNTGSGNSVSLEAQDGSSWQQFTVALNLANPYFIQYTIDPLTATYSATVSEVDTSGNVLSSDTLSDLAITGNAINNHQNGQLLFYLNTSAGTANIQVDNINITAASAPEPAGLALFTGGGLTLFALIKRRNLCR